MRRLPTPAPVKRVLTTIVINQLLALSASSLPFRQWAKWLAERGAWEWPRLCIQYSFIIVSFHCAHHGSPMLAIGTIVTPIDLADVKRPHSRLSNFVVTIQKKETTECVYNTITQIEYKEC